MSRKECKNKLNNHRLQIVPRIHRRNAILQERSCYCSQLPKKLQQCFLLRKAQEGSSSGTQSSSRRRRTFLVHWTCRNWKTQRTCICDSGNGLHTSILRSLPTRTSSTSSTSKSTSTRTTANNSRESTHASHPTHRTSLSISKLTCSNSSTNRIDFFF